MKHLIHKAFTAINRLLDQPIYFLSLLTPRDKKTWVFIGWHRKGNGEIFADNTKYLFLYVSQHHPEIKAVWLAKSRELAKELTSQGYKSYYQNSLRGILTGLIAGFTFVDAYIQGENYRLMGRTRIVQLLHGRGMKKDGYSHPQLINQNYIFGPSEPVLSMLGPRFVKKAKKYIGGYSRNDIFFSAIPGSDISIDKSALAKIQEIKNSSPKTRIILYAPTFRRGLKFYDLDKYLESESLSSWLREKNIVLFINLHPKYRDQERRFNLPGTYFITESDIYPLLPLFDLLITDYSSIFPDFLLLNRPIVFYPYDREEYEAKEGFYYDYDKFTPGPKAYNPFELREKIIESLTNNTDKKVREKILNYYHQYKDRNSSKRIVSILNEKENLGMREVA